MSSPETDLRGLSRPRPARPAAARALLLDVDGVLLDTAAGYERIWAAWAAELGLDVPSVLALLPGRRTEDVIRHIAPGLDLPAQRRTLDRLMRAELPGIRPVPGAHQLLAGLDARPWAIVTSGSRWSVHACFRTCGLPLPGVQVYGEDVRHGKPAPDAYLLAARRLGLPAADCVVVEDAPAGVAAGKQAGCTVIAISTTRSPAELAGADACVDSLAAVAELVLPDPGLRAGADGGDGGDGGDG